jgi:hypothetical protein
MPIARPKKKGAQKTFDTEWTLDRIEETTEVNRIRERVDARRAGGYVSITSTTRRLLEYWNNPERERKLFFCQREAVETAIYIAEVSARFGDAWIQNLLNERNAEHNAGLPRLAMKMATGTGGVRFEVDGRELADTQARTEDRAPVSIRLGRRRLPSAIGFIARHRGTLAEGRQGIAISTYGKVIKRGWDWLGLAPAARAQITGLIEAPDLAACLTLSKSDFIRTGARGASYLAFRKAIQEVVSRQLAAWGDTREGDARPRVTKLDRDLERVLEDLADDFPLLRSLVDRRAGGQKRLPMPGRGDGRVPGPLFANVSIAHEPATSIDGAPRFPTVEKKQGGEMDGDPARGGARSGDGGTEPPSEPDEPPASNAEPPASDPRSAAPGAAHVPPDGGSSPNGAAAVGTLETVPGRRRPARYGLIVQFESRPDSLEPGRLVDSTIWINDAHPAYVRAAASRSAGYHIALAVALSLAPLAVEPQEEHDFITQFLAHWGGAHDGIRRGRRRGGRARTAGRG